MKKQKKEFFWNVKKLVSVPACPVHFDDYKMNANNAVTTNIDESTKKDTRKNPSIKDGVVLNVEGLNNKAYKSSTDNLANLQFEVYEPKMNDETFEISIDDSTNPHFLQFEMTETKANNEDYEVSEDNSENPHFLQFEMTNSKANNKDYEISTDNSLNSHYQKFEIPKPKVSNGEVKERKEDITISKKADQNGINTKSTNGNNRKIRIKAKREIKVRKSIKDKLKMLYTNVSFVLLMISLCNVFILNICCVHSYSALCCVGEHFLIGSTVFGVHTGMFSTCW